MELFLGVYQDDTDSSQPLFHVTLDFIVWNLLFQKDAAGQDAI